MYKLKQPKELPKSEDVIFDIEVLHKVSPYPVFAIAASEYAWYAWCCTGLIDGSMKPAHELITFGHPDDKRLIVGHNVSYDRARIKEEYRFEASAFGFVDTMSLHCAVGGLSSQQRPQWLKFKKEEQQSQIDTKEVENDWLLNSSMNSLNHVAKLYLGKSINKSARDAFKGTMEQISPQDKFQELMNYCAEDVEITHQIHSVLLPKFLQKCSHPISFAGFLHMVFF